MPATSSSAPASAVRRGPYRRSARAAAGAPSTISAVSGSIRSAVANGPSRSASWSRKVVLNRAPNSPAEEVSSSTSEPITGRDRATGRGTTGSAVRRSWPASRASRAAAAASSASVPGAVQPRPGTSARACTSTASAVASSAAPARSSRCRPRSTSGGRSARVIAAISTATGALIQNTDRQPNCATSTPPSSGPAAAASAIAPVRTAIARPSRSGGQHSLSSASVPGCSSAPNAPWATRSAITQPTVGAAAMPAEAAPKPSTPASSVGRCP